MPDKAKILFLDIETAPNLAHVWGLWNENIPLDRLLEEGHILCFAAKFLGESKVYSSSLFYDGEVSMAAEAFALMNEADAIVTYNGDKFDLPHLNRLLLNNELDPPAPYKKVDLLKTVRQQFKFASNKLAFVAQQLQLGAKADNGGYATWIGCMNDDPVSWNKMIKYNKSDVILTEKLYKKIKPWIKNHPNMGLFVENPAKPVCPKCGSKHLERRGWAHTNSGSYRRFHCLGCGDWSRSRFLNEEREDNILVRVP